MVAKIGHGENITGALEYNQHKVHKDNGKILLLHKMVETPGGNYSVAQLSRSFAPYLMANRRTEKPVLHISLNPDPADKVSDNDFKQMAQQYMQEMGYGGQPFVVYKHTDIERTHIHIVSVNVNQEGKKISDKFECMRSMEICRSLEKSFNLRPATEKRSAQDRMAFKPVNYRAGDVKSQIAAVVRHLPKAYHFHSFGGYNALLSLFSITAEKVIGEIQGSPKQGMVYFALNEKGEKASNPFKASLFGRSAGYAQLQARYEQSKESLKDSTAKPLVKAAIEIAMRTSKGEASFKQQLLEQGITAVIRRNADARIYGMTFIDHTSKTVWNGSQFSKDLSANAFNEWWNKGSKPKAALSDNLPSGLQDSSKEDSSQGHDLFSFLTKGLSDIPKGDTVPALGMLLPESQGEDHEELDFDSRMKRKKKKRNTGGRG